MRIAVAVGGGRVPAWQRNAVDALRALDGVTVRVVRVAAPAWQPPRGPIARLAGTALAPAELRLDGGDLAGHDLVLDLSGADIVADAPHGVWSFRLGGSDDATLPFARELSAGAATVDVVLARRLGGRRTRLRTGRFGLSGWYPVATRIALAEAGRWPATFVAALVAGTVLTGEADGPAAPRRGPLGAGAQVRFAATMAARIATGLASALTKVDQWNVGFAEGGPRRLLRDEPLEIRWLPEPRPRSFLADPFLVERDGLRALFAEDFDYVRDRGVIDVLVLDAQDRIVRRERVLDVPTHLSYPFPLEIDGELYLIPENCAANEVALYRCVRFPDSWERESALFPAFDGVDTTFFAHDGRWWAFCTRFSRGSSLALYAYHSPSPRGPWTAHGLNPIVVDVAGARPAGPPFVVDGVLYRLGQDCSRTYGGAVVIARVDALTPDAYRETVVRRLTPQPSGRYRDGIHTVSFAGDTIVVDGKKTYRDARNAARGLRSIFGRRVARLLRRPAVTEATSTQAASARGR